MASNDPTVVRRVLANVHATLSLLLDRLDAMEKSGTLGEVATEDLRGWWERARRALAESRTLGLDPNQQPVQVEVHSVDVVDSGVASESPSEVSGNA